MSRPNHILVIRLSALGDVAMVLPVIRAFIHQYPKVKITMLTRASYAALFKDLINVEILSADLMGVHKGVFGLYKLSKQIRKLKVDAVADLHNVLRTNILKTFLFNIPVLQIDKGRAEKRALINGEKFQQLKTTFQRYENVFEELGFPLDLSNPEFPKREKLNHDITNFIGSENKNWIGIAPFAAHAGKMYPLDLMKSVIESLSEKNKIILFGGGKSETEQLNKIASKYLNVVNVANRFNLSEELNIISNLDVMISMDSGNAHLAAMMGIRVITLWGVTHPYAGFYPFNQDINDAILSDRKKYPKIPTSIYGNKMPEGYEDAMRTISPESIIQKVNYLTRIN
ncbi:ADP-heptose:LPS heptosyltransferase [Flavobacteriaceae bacterium MAR_2010_188]|nr:ADP-heptose:LPS heptosyltransferase [Flavobacteriaceae bacterium MAR_2010_188]